MKLHIESWVEEKGYSTNIKGLFSESVICYRNGAYRASLIFSYIGFLTIIKETIIKSQRPSTFIEAEWLAIIAKLNNDDTWEKEVFEVLIKATKPIFPLNEDLRLQLRYWKDRRNDCAHFKQNEIESHHTEAFWSFIKSNLPKMTVEGGAESLLNKFEAHFDETKTPSGEDFAYLVKEIENSVLITELHYFFKKLKFRIDSTRFWHSDSDAAKVYCKILDITNHKIQESLVDYLKQEERDIKFLNSFPEKVLQLNYSTADIRTLWKERIYDSALSINPFNIYSGLLRNNLIPSGQISEANRELFNSFSQSTNRKLPEGKDIETLKANGFFDTVFKIAIEEKDLSKYSWVNEKCDLIISFIENYPLNLKTVKSICEMAERTNFSQWLVKALQDTFANSPDLKTEFHKIATSNSIKIPTVFK